MPAFRMLPTAMALAVVAACTAAPIGSSSLETSSTRPSVASSVSGAPRPTRTAAATRATPIAVAGATRLPPGGAIDPGRYFIPKGAWAAATFSFTMPAGWVAENGGQTITKHPDGPAGHVSWSVAIIDRVFADPCGPNDTIEPGPAAADLAAALVDLPGPAASGPTDITLGGRAGQSVDLTIPPGVDVSKCDPPIGLQIWLDRSGNKYLVVIREGPTRVYAIDVDGARFVITRDYNRTAAPDDLAEFEAIMASITFEP